MTSPPSSSSFAFSETLTRCSVNLSLTSYSLPLATSAPLLVGELVRTNVESMQGESGFCVTYSQKQHPILVIYGEFREKIDSNSFAIDKPHQMLSHSQQSPPFKSTKNLEIINPSLAVQKEAFFMNNRQEQRASSDNNQPFPTFTSVSHAVTFNTRTDSFSVDLRVETEKATMTYRVSCAFGKFLHLASCNSTLDLISSPLIAVKKEQLQLSSSPSSFSDMLSEERCSRPFSLSASTGLSSAQSSCIQLTQSQPLIAAVSSSNSNEILPSLPSRMKYISHLPIEDNREVTQLNACGLNITSQKSLESFDGRLSSHHESIQQQRKDSASSASGKSNFDKKNVVKNFVKAFDTFFLDSLRDVEFTIRFSVSREQLYRMRSEYEKRIRLMKFNNKMIIAIILSNAKNFFEFFLLTDAQKWIAHSSVLDKQAHNIILNDYLRAIDNPNNIPNIVNLRVRNRDIKLAAH